MITGGNEMAFYLQDPQDATAAVLPRGSKQYLVKGGMAVGEPGPIWLEAPVTGSMRGKQRLRKSFTGKEILYHHQEFYNLEREGSGK